MSDDRIVEAFDRELGQLHGLPGVTSTRQATVRHVGLVESSTFIVQTYRQRDLAAEDAKAKPSRDTIFLEYIGAGGKAFRVVLPPGVAEVIARQRDQLGTINRRRGARAAVDTKRAAGIDPAAALRKFRKTKRSGK